MEPKDVAQLVVSALAPFVAAGSALALLAFGRRERVSTVIGWEHDARYGEMDLIVIHNHSDRAVAIHAIRYLEGVIWRTAQQGTALDYEDPTDLGFPYLIQPNEMRRLRLDSMQARRLARRAGRWRKLVALVLRRSRILVECQSTAGTRFRTSGEPALPWDDQLPWRRGR